MERCRPLKTGGRFLLLVLVWAAMAAAAEEWRVGDGSGWVVGAVDYSLWAAARTFLVGDVLVFNYLSEFHSVLEVTKYSYDRCNLTDPISRHADGNTRFRLDKAATFYFVCGINKHCALGQKLEVWVRNPVSDLKEPGPIAAPHGLAPSKQRQPMPIAAPHSHEPSNLREPVPIAAPHGLLSSLPRSCSPLSRTPASFTYKFFLLYCVMETLTSIVQHVLVASML